MSDKKNLLDDIIRSVKQQRDEVKLKLHLASMDAQDEYERLSGKTEELLSQYEPVKDAVDETADNVLAALSLAAEEMKNGFTRIWDSLDGDEQE